MSSVTLNSGTGGANLGTDQVTGTPNIDYQVVKLGIAAAGSAPTLASGNSGTKDGGTLRVVLATDQPSLSNAIPVSQSGTWTIQQGGAPWSNNITQFGGNNVVTADYDTGAGTQTMMMLGLALPASGGAVAGGTASNPIQVSVANTAANGTAIKVDGSAVTQPVSGTFWQTTQPVSASSLPLPTGAATAAKQPALGTAGTASADVITVQGIASMTALKVDGSGVTQPVSISGNQAVNIAQANGAAVNIGAGNAGTGTLRVILATDQPSLANAQPVSQSGTWTVQPGNTANTTPWLTSDTPATSGGLSFNYVLSAASNNLTQVKGSAGQLYLLHATNTNAAARYVKVFNKASANVTMGTTAADFQFVIPGNTAGAGIVLPVPCGIAMGTGITIAITAGVSLTDNTSAAANEVSLLVGYK